MIAKENDGACRLRFGLGPSRQAACSRRLQYVLYGHLMGILDPDTVNNIQRLAALGIGWRLRLEHAGRYI